MLFCMVFWRFWRPSEALLDSLGGSGRGLGRLGQAFEALNCVLDASWQRLGRFLEVSWGQLWRLGGVRKPFQSAKGRPRPHFKRVQGCFGMVLFVFFRGLRPKWRISKNVGFQGEQFIFWRVRPLKIDQTSRTNQSWRLEYGKIHKNLILDANN